MREVTNLHWPEAPFGAEQRPYGQRSDMLAAFAIDWAPQLDARPLPVATATVYLRVRRHGTAQHIGEDTLAIGFRVVVIEDAADVPHLLAMTDRALTRARRHAAILAGHALGDDLTRMQAVATTSLRGVAGVLDAWTDRTVRQRGMALMVDTAIDAGTAGAELDMPLDPLPTPVPHDRACRAAVARVALARCLAVGLTAAVYAGRYRWEVSFRVTDAIDRTAWDVLSADDHIGDHDTPSRDTANLDTANAATVNQDGPSPAAVRLDAVGLAAVWRGDTAERPAVPRRG